MLWMRLVDRDRGEEGLEEVEGAAESLGAATAAKSRQSKQLLRIVKLSHHEVGSRARYLFDVPRAL